MTVEPIGTEDIPAADRVAELCAEQDGVIARWQVAERGLSAAFIRRKLRRREWATVHRGVFVNHTGPLTWRRRAWAAILGAYPAALSHESALYDEGETNNRPSSDPIHIVVDRQRRVIRRPGVVVHYGSRLDDKVRWHTHPPRVRVEEAVLDVAAEASSDIRVVAGLVDAVQAGKTTADRLLKAIELRPGIARRAFIKGVLVDVRDGTCSVLEHGYLTKVERAHGLPQPERQARTTVGRRGFRDVDYAEWGVVIELDGRTGHDGPAARDQDMERDLDAAVGAARVTLRIGWGQVYDRPCTTARKVASVLTDRGWGGTLTRCPSCASLP